MSFEKFRKDMIHLRSANARNPVLTHRYSTMISQGEHLMRPANTAHRLRLTAALDQTAREIAAARREGGRYVPSHQRRRPYRKSR